MIKNIQNGGLSDKFKETKYKAVFEEQAIVKGILPREWKVMVPDKLQTYVLKLAHKGHPRTAAMLGQLPEIVWLPGMKVDVKDFVASCILGC